MQLRAAATDRDAALRIAAWAAVLIGSLFNLLNHNEYPALSGEVGIVLLGVALLAGLLGAVHRLAMPRLSFLFTGLLAGLAADLNALPAGVVLACAAAGAAAAWLREEIVLKLIACAFLGVAVFQLIGLHWRPAEPVSLVGGAEAPARGERPALVHIVFDAYLGLEGMAADEAAFGALRREHQAFFLRHGFRVYEGAYSPHRNTVNSLPQLFSFGAFPLPTRPVRRQLPPAPYFRMLHARGYRTHVLQTDFIDLCGTQQVADCVTFRGADLSSVHGTELPVSGRAAAIAATFASMAVIPSALANAASRAWSALSGEPHRDLDRRVYLFPLASLKASRSFEAALERARPGHAYVAHFLMPHDPFALDAECRVLPKAQWTWQEEPLPRENRDRRYADQVRCALKRLDAMLDALARSPAGEDAIVIVNGDHGSRVNDAIPEAGGPPVSVRDYAMSYSTLFAVRAPGIAAGVAPGRAPIEALLGGFAGSGFRAAPPAGEADPHVFLANRAWVPRRKVPLPEYGKAISH